MDASQGSGPPPKLVEAQTWGSKAVAFAMKNIKKQDVLLCGKETIGVSSMFSGMVYPERALEYLSAGRRLVIDGAPTLTDSLFCLQTLF